MLKILLEKEKMLITSIFSFTRYVFYPSKNKFNFSVAFILSAENAFNLDQSKILSFGKELTFYQTTKFGLNQTENIFRQQNKRCSEQWFLSQVG